MHYDTRGAAPKAGSSLAETGHGLFPRGTLPSSSALALRLGMARVTHIVESSLYARDIKATANFYATVLGLSAMLETPRLVAFDAGNQSVLLVFQEGATGEDVKTDEGVIPGHDGQGRLHVALGIPADSLSQWRERLATHSVPIVSETRWKGGGTSLYFHDPDGHVVELATPGLWANY
jgi:catechol 2,3-dioxygenase-like lactoylglutathione lyase family enzyme